MKVRAMERYRVKTVTINDQMLDIYREFAGDIDGYARCGKPSQRLVIDDEQWIALTNFLQELHVLASWACDAAVCGLA